MHFKTVRARFVNNFNESFSQLGFWPPLYGSATIVHHLPPMAQGDLSTVMQAYATSIQVTSNTYAANLVEQTASFLTAQGMQVVEQGIPTRAANQTVLFVYTPKAVRFTIFD